MENNEVELGSSMGADSIIMPISSNLSAYLGEEKETKDYISKQRVYKIYSPDETTILSSNAIGTVHRILGKEAIVTFDHSEYKDAAKFVLEPVFNTRMKCLVYFKVKPKW